MGEPEQVAELLQSQYYRAFSTPKFKSLDDIKSRGMDSVGEWSKIQFIKESMEKAMGELLLNSASGPDGVSSILLRKCSKALSKALFCLWRRSVETSSIPEKLKEANITPIYKGGKRICQELQTSKLNVSHFENF